jgi:toxin co-regulated pilus biosynthesis protein Q
MNKLAIIAGISIFCAGCASGPAPVPPPPVPVPPPKAAVVNLPVAAAPAPLPVIYPKNAIVRQKPLASIAVYPGSLRENIERIAAHYGWHNVVWDAQQDFTWVGYAQIQGDTLASVLRQLLADYPLQAIFYQGNHVLYIHPRTLK